MRLVKFIVKDLFGRFDHTIQLHEDGITILFGLNGFGKTTVLKMIDACLNQRYSSLKRHNFNSINAIYSDGSELVIERTTEQIKRIHARSRLGVNLTREFAKLQIKYKTPSDNKWKQVKQINEEDDQSIRMLTHYVDRRLPFLTRVGMREWKNDKTGESLSLEEIVDRFGDEIDIDHDLQIGVGRIKHFNEIAKPVFIQTQRLLPETNIEKEQRYSKGSKTSQVEAFAADLSRKLLEILAKSAEKTQSLDRTFPHRLLRANSSTGDTNEKTLRRRFDEQIEKRKKLIETGILVEDNENAELPKKKLDDLQKVALKAYLDDSDIKLAEFDEIQMKVELFANIINSRFAFKTIKIHRDLGFWFETDELNRIEPNDLSSGEQHELVLFYYLLFKVDRDSLVMIDEPELSLHIAWQRKFMEDVKKVITLNPFYVVLATHSPQIVGKMHEFMIELKGR